MDATDHTTEGGPEAPSARPSLDAVLALEPDWEDATLWALQAGTAEPLPRLRAAQDAADADTARHIAEALPAGGPARRRALVRLDADLAAAAMPLMRRAIAAAHDLHLADAAYHRAMAGDTDAEPEAAAARARAALRDAAETAAAACAAAAHLRGAERAIRLARQGRPWIPPGLQRAMDERDGVWPPPPAP